MGNLSEEQQATIIDLVIDVLEATQAVELVDILARLQALDASTYLRREVTWAMDTGDDETIFFLNPTLSLLLKMQKMGAPAAAERFLRAKQETLEALEALDNAPGAEEFYQLLEKHQHLLLSDLALFFMTITYDELLTEDEDVIAAGRLQQHIELFKEARASGLAAAWQRVQAEDQQIIDMLDQFEKLDAEYEECYHFLYERRELLVTEKAAWFLQMHAADLREQGDPMADYYESHAFLLKDACKRGLLAAWNDFVEVDQMIQELQDTEEMDKILQLFRRHERVLETEITLVMMRNYIARARADGKQDQVDYFERWLMFMEMVRDSGIKAAWGQFYLDLLRQVGWQSASLASSRISDYTRELSRQTPGTLEWADLLCSRGNHCYPSMFSATEDSKSRLKQAIDDYSAALPVYRQYGKYASLAETQEALGTALYTAFIFDNSQGLDMMRVTEELDITALGTREDPYPVVHDPLRYRQRAVEALTQAIDLYKEQGNQESWARTLLRRAMAHRLASWPSAHGTFQAIDDYTAVLSVVKEENSAWEWAAAVSNRGLSYLMIMGPGYDERLKRAIADLQAVLRTYTRQGAPALYRKTQYYLFEAFKNAKRWEEAYQALREVIAVQRDLLALNPDEGRRAGLISTIANVHVQVYIRAAEVLLHFKQIPLEEMACLLEEARAQNLRMVLSLDALDPERSGTVASRRVGRFFAAYKAWRTSEPETGGDILFSGSQLQPLPGLARSFGVEEQPDPQVRQAQEKRATVLQAIKDIRMREDPDFMAPQPVFEDIVQAVQTPGTALIYLAAGMETGLALLLIRTPENLLQKHLIPLPQLKSRALARLIETESGQNPPINLERALTLLTEPVFHDLVPVLSKSKVRRVRLVPFGALGLFPFPALQVRAGHGEKKYLGELFEVTVAPSAQAFVLSERRAACIDRTTHPYLLLAGNPSPRPAGVNNLPYAQVEAETIQRLARRFSYPEKDIRFLPSSEITK
ncbi:MAG TPA: CHAT domain-containing protein, partial [Ktedonobacteraceae bacterium]|nr:CHAT domain-containing protein [Ktedonobacteraceae bacterium]